MEEWSPTAPETLDPNAYQATIELVPLPGLALTVLALIVSGAARGHVWVRLAFSILALATIVLTVRAVVGFDATRVRSRGKDHRWTDLVSVRSYKKGVTRYLVLTFKTGVVATTSRMWRFDRLAEYVASLRKA